MRRATEMWMRDAQDDVIACRALIGAGVFGRAAFCAQQAAEKALKALYVEVHGEPPPQVHGLGALAQYAVGEAPEAMVDLLAQLDRHYAPGRYPSGLEAASDRYGKADAKEALEQCCAILQWTAARLRGSG